MTKTTPTNTTAAVANRLYEFCSQDRHHEAIQELYADNARHVEAMEMPGSACKRITEGKAAILQMSENWSRSTTVHSASVGKPLVNGEQFVCEMSMDCTSTEGPMAGQRMQVSEICLYTVNDGKITEAKFFYPGCEM